VKLDHRSYMDAVYAMDRVRYAKLVAGFVLFAWQRRLLASPHKFKCLNCARQAGKSSIIAVVPTHTAKYKPGSRILVLAATEDQATDDMLKIKACMARDPTYPKLIRESDSLVVTEDESRIEVLCTTEKSARGRSKPSLIIVDEASRVEDVAITSGIIPMLTDNPDCELLVPSTPNGRTGFFFRVFHDRSWERYYVRSPYTPTSGTSLEMMQTEEEFSAEQEARGIIGYYSPRHRNLDHQLNVQLKNLGQQQYRQEQCGEFVEPDAQLFSYSDIARAFAVGEDLRALKSGVIVRDDIQAFREEPEEIEE
jgi:hypothetical protein